MNEDNLSESVLSQETSNPTVHGRSRSSSRRVSRGDTSPRE